MSLRSRRLQLLKQPAFGFYALSCLMATLGTGISYVGLTWLILQFGSSVSSVSLLMLCFWGPVVLFGPLLGVVADRYSRKWLIVISNACRAVLFMLFGVLMQHISSALMVYSLMLLNGLFFALFFPAAVAFVRELVGSNDLLYANSTIDIAYELGNVAGMGMAGFIIAWFTTPIAIFINGMVFAVTALVQIFIQVRRQQSAAASTFSLWSGFRSGVVYLQQHSSLILIYSIQLLILVAFMTAPVLLAPFSKNVLHANAIQFGQIEASLSLGVICGGLSIPWVAEKLGFMRSLYILCLVNAICFALFSFNHYLLIAEILYFAMGFMLAVWPLIVTKAQDMTRLDYQARIQSLFNSFSGIIILMVYALIDFGGRYVLITELYWFEVLLMLIAALLAWCNRQRFSTVLS